MFECVASHWVSQSASQSVNHKYFLFFLNKVVYCKNSSRCNAVNILNIYLCCPYPYIWCDKPKWIPSLGLGENALVQVSCEKSIWKNAIITQSSTIKKKSKNNLKSKVLKQSATVWHSDITEENSKYLCWVQEAAVKIIMSPGLVSYSHGLQALDIYPLP